MRFSTRRLVPVALLLLAACSPRAQPGPTPKPTPPPSSTPVSRTPVSLSAIQRLDTRIGFVGAAFGAALAKTSDGGATWQRLTIPMDYVTALRFIDERVGWASGRSSASQGVVLRTEDGGRSWQTVLAISASRALSIDVIHQIQAVDGQRAWALTFDPSVSCQLAACASNLERTTDGGQSWTIQMHGELAAIRFASATRGWVALDDTPTAGTVEVRETSDGGATWRTALRTATGQAAGLDAATIDAAWLLTRDGAYCSASNCDRYAMFHTGNGGLAWSPLGNPKDFTRTCSGGHLAGPLFASPQRGWLGIDLGAGGANVGPGGILSSEDGGTSWRCSTTPPNISLVSAADPRHLWAAVRTAVISRRRSTPLTMPASPGIAST